MRLSRALAPAARCNRCDALRNIGGPQGSRPDRPEPRSVTEAMMPIIRITASAVVLIAALSQTVRAQSAAPAPQSHDWEVAVYPILAWVPLGIDIGVDVPPSDGSGGESTQAVDSPLDGAFFGGFAVSNGVWRIEGYGIWASVGGERPPRPLLAVDLDLIYGDVKGGRRIAPDPLIPVAGGRGRPR